MNGLSVQQELVSQGIERPIIFLSGRGTVPAIVEAMKAGAVDSLPKPVKDDDLLNAIKVAEERDRVRLQRAAERKVIRKLIDKLTPREKEVMILTFHRVQVHNRKLGGAFGTTWVFVGAYLLVWACAGLIAYAGMLAAKTAAVWLALSSATTAQIGGAIIVLAGIYQLAPLKEVCLSKCREPLAFIVTSWHSSLAIRTTVMRRL